MNGKAYLALVEQRNHRIDSWVALRSIEEFDTLIPTYHRKNT
jgi:hypothetical protein